MKRLVCAAVVAGSMFAMADEEVVRAEAVTPAAEAAKAAPESVKVAPKRPQYSPEQREKMRAQREKFVSERRAKMEAQILEVVKKYVPEEEKAQALVRELQEAMMNGRRSLMRRPPKPGAEKPVEGK